MGRANELMRHGCGTIVELRKPCPKCEAVRLSRTVIPAAAVAEWPHVGEGGVPFSVALEHMTSHPAVRYRAEHPAYPSLAKLQYFWARELRFKVLAGNDLRSGLDDENQSALRSAVWTRLA